MGIGAGLMYFFDPDRGRRRRALVRDHFFGAVNDFNDFIDVTRRDFEHRVQGQIAEIGSMFAGDGADDRVLAERVRARMGRLVSHPKAIEVEAHDGRVTLHGPVLAHEVPGLLAAVHSVRGVRATENQLEVHEQPDVSALQGEGHVPGDRYDVMQANWAPSTRFVAGTIGSALMANCVARRTPGAVLLGTAGFGLFMRALENRPLKQQLGLGRDLRQGIMIQKTLEIAAPVERVFEFVRDFQNLARFMPAMKEVRSVGDNRVRWTLRAPTGGKLIEVDELITEMVPNKVISWETEAGSPVAETGTVRFQSLDPNRSRVDIHMRYQPPAGTLGHVVASLFGMDPKTQLEEALIRMKTYLETGHLPHAVAQAAEAGSAPGA
jgi:uncharacterized membrane protein